MRNGSDISANTSLRTIGVVVAMFPLSVSPGRRPIVFEEHAMVFDAIVHVHEDRVKHTRRPILQAEVHENHMHVSAGLIDDSRSLTGP
eukprot:COSAG02_NODE_2024_length_10084_cov_130.539509_9_plen_88_part_00